MDLRTHWDAVYRTKPVHEVSWFQPVAQVSLALIQRAAPDRFARIIDVGGGASTLVDGLVAAGYRQLTVLDLSESALAVSKARLGAAGRDVVWLVADVLSAPLPTAAFDLWHDRAAFHFLLSAGDRVRYVEQVRQAVAPGGFVIVATFAEDGPTRCSGLPAARYSADALLEQFGSGFRLVESVREVHLTPSGVAQPFIYCLCQVEPSAQGIVAA